jgi:predicted AAA+ superfamily ATPase
MLDDTLFELSRQLVGQLLRQQRRQLGESLSGRCHLLTGPRGVGKSTWTAQYLADKSPDYGSSTECLYLPADHFLLAGRSLYELAEVFVRRGGRLLCLDEVHRADHWSRDLKSLADTFPQLEILATGSSLLHLQKGSHDLSRRFLVHSMEGLSFREYLQLKHDLSLPVLPLHDLLADHRTHAASLLRQLAETGAPVLKHFQDYLRRGYYAYGLEFENEAAYVKTLQQSAQASLESDLPAVHPTITGASIKRIRRLLAAIAGNVPFTPDFAKMRRRLQIADDRTLKDYLAYLEDARLIRILRREGSPMGSMDKPDRIYLGDPNLASALCSPEQPDRGALREIFLLASLPPELPVCAAPKGHFLLDGRHTLEVGGPRKDSAQIKNLKNAYLAIDDIEQGSTQRIPLWLFGFLR